MLTSPSTLAAVAGTTDTQASPAAGTQTHSPPHTYIHTHIHRGNRALHSRVKKEFNKETGQILLIRCKAQADILTSHCSHTADPFCSLSPLFSHICSSLNYLDPSLSSFLPKLPVLFHAIPNCSPFASHVVCHTCAGSNLLGVQGPPESFSVDTVSVPQSTSLKLSCHSLGRVGGGQELPFSSRLEFPYPPLPLCGPSSMCMSMCAVCGYGDELLTDGFPVMGPGILGSGYNSGYPACRYSSVILSVCVCGDELFYQITW